MKENKNIAIICVIISVVSFIFALILCDNKNDLASGFFLDICTGAILSGVIAAITCYAQKNEKIFRIKENIKEEVEKYINIFDKIEYVYDKKEMERELKEANLYELNKDWLDNFIKSNEEIKKQNIKILKKISNPSMEYLKRQISELKKVCKKIEILEIDTLSDKIQDIYSQAMVIEIAISSKNERYFRIQKKIFSIIDGSEKELEIKNNEIYPTDKNNIILENLEKIREKVM